MPAQRAKLAFEMPNGELRALMSLERRAEGSVYLFPKARERGYLDWSDFPRARSVPAPDLHLSVHRSGWVHFRTREKGPDGEMHTADLTRFKIPALERMDAPTYIVQILTPELDAYPTVRTPRKNTFTFSVAGTPGPISSIVLAVGPSMKGKVEEGTRRVPLPTLPNGGQFYGVLTVELEEFYFAAATIGPAEGEPAPNPPEMETWAPIRSENEEDYLPRRAED